MKVKLFLSCLAGLMDVLGKGYLQGSRGVVFLHAGGPPALFAYEEELLKYLEPSR